MSSQIGRKLSVYDLYFGVAKVSPTTGDLHYCNIFNSIKVMRCVAFYIAKSPKVVDPLEFCFGDTKDKMECEMEVRGMYRDHWFHTDIYNMYVVPNRDYLLNLLSKVSKKSAEKWLKDNPYM